MNMNVITLNNNAKRAKISDRFMKVIPLSNIQHFCNPKYKVHNRMMDRTMEYEDKTKWNRKEFHWMYPFIVLIMPIDLLLSSANLVRPSGFNY